LDQHSRTRSKLSRYVRIVRVVARRLRHRLKKIFSATSTGFSRLKARMWHQLYVVRYRYLVWKARHGVMATAIILLLSAGVSAIWIPALQGTLDPHFSVEGRLESLRSLFLTLGGALIGAAAIVSSLVLFAMQVNVERMPHGLFRRLSADRRLLNAFAGTFLLAVLVTALSQIPDRHWIGVATFCAFWGTVLVLSLFLYGYRRALALINPVRQLRLVVGRIRWELDAWVRRAKRAAPLLDTEKVRPEPRDNPYVQQHDMARLSFFQSNPHWTDGAMQGVRYAVSFARRYAEQGDYEVSAEAVNAILEINRAYVKAKGKTFFAHQILFDNPLTSDRLILDTLEHLRQNARIGVARRDEVQIEQTLRAMAALVKIYLVIDYGGQYVSKTHAHLAAGYLSAEVERIAPHKMADVMMEGVRLMGQCADMLLAAEGPKGITALTQKIGVISCIGVANEDYRPVTSTGVEQLARLSFDLLFSHSRDVRYVAEVIRSSINMIAKLFLLLPDSPLTNIHSTYLGPYYSATSTQALSARLIALVNEISNAESGNANVCAVINNIDEWAEGIYETEKELLIQAVAKRSHFTFDMVHWITTVTSMLLAVSNAAACDKSTQVTLRRNADWLIAVLSWIPDDKETVKFVENFQMTETLFKSAIDARCRGCAKVADHIDRMMLSWMFNAGRYHTGWSTLERSIYGLATLALLNDDVGAVGTLKAEITARLGKGELPSKEVRDNAAREVRGRAKTLYREGHWSSAIENSMAQVDRQKLQPLLEEIADLVSPETAGQAFEHRLL
jgi:hypothetical protein